MQQSPTSGRVIGSTEIGTQLAALAMKIRTPVLDLPRNADGSARVELGGSGWHQQLLDKSIRVRDNQAILDLLPDQRMALDIITAAMLNPQDLGEGKVQWSSDTDALSSDLAGALLDETKSHIGENVDMIDLVPRMIKQILAITGSFPVLCMPENAVDELINGQKKTTLEGLTNLGYSPELNTFRSIGILGDPYKEKSEGKKLTLEHYFKTKNNQQVKYEHRVRYSFPEQTFHQTDSSGKVTPIKVQAFEAFSDYITITDNPTCLRMPELLERMQQKVTTEAFGSLNAYSQQNQTNHIAISQLNDMALRRAFSKRGNTQPQVTRVALKQSELFRNSVGTPLWKYLPGESIITVYPPGDPENHAFYICVLDEQGHPVTAATLSPLMANALSQNSAANQGIESNIVQRAAANFGAGHLDMNPNDIIHRNFMAKLHADAIEKDVLARAQAGGLTSGDLSFSFNSDLYWAMAARSFEGRRTQLLFIPKEYLVYAAVEYNDDGTGRSVLDASHTLNMMRSVTLTAGFVGAMRNANPVTDLNIQLDPDDPMPEKTKMRVIDESIRMRSAPMPRHVNIPEQISYIQRTGIRVNTSGHEGMPALQVTSSQQSLGYQRPDDTFTEEIKRLTIMQWGLPPELVDQSFSPEFAALITSQNNMAAKKIRSLQRILGKHTTRMMRLYGSYDETLKTKLLGIIKNNMKGIRIQDDELRSLVGPFDETKKDEIKAMLALRSFLLALECKFTQPASGTMQAQLDEFNLFEQSLDAALDKAIMSSDLFANDATGSEQAGNVANSWKSLTKAYYLRQYMVEKNFLPELMKLTAPSDDGKVKRTVLLEASKHVRALMSALAIARNDLSPVAKAFDKDISGMGGTNGESSGSTSSDTGGDDGGGSDPFGGDFSLSFGSEDEANPPSTGEEGSSTGTETKKEEPEEPVDGDRPE